MTVQLMLSRCHLVLTLPIVNAAAGLHILKVSNAAIILRYVMSRKSLAGYASADTLDMRLIDTKRSFPVDLTDTSPKCPDKSRPTNSSPSACDIQLG